MSPIKPGGKVERKGPGRLMERVADVERFPASSLLLYL